MRSQFIFFAFMLYTTSIISDDVKFQQQPPHIYITLNANTDANLDQENDIDQKSRHQSQSDIDINGNEDGRKALQEEKKLEPTVSITNYTIRNGVKLFGVYILAHHPIIFPAYLANRLIIYPSISDTPWLDEATEEETAKLAQQGKCKIPEPIIYPIAHHMYKTIKEKFFQDCANEDL